MLHYTLLWSVVKYSVQTVHGTSWSTYQSILQPPTAICISPSFLGEMSLVLNKAPDKATSIVTYSNTRLISTEKLGENLYCGGGGWMTLWYVGHEVPWTVWTYNVIQICTVLYYTLLYCSDLSCTAYCTVLHCTVLHYNMLYCTLL